MVGPAPQVRRGPRGRRGRGRRGRGRPCGRVAAIGAAPSGSQIPRRCAITRRVMITVQDVTKAFGPKKLFEDVSVSFAPGNRYGLTGPNGAGKSTFMKILSGDEDSDTGQVFRPKKLGVLKQDHFRYEDNRVIDVVLMGNEGL